MPTLALTAAKTAGFSVKPSGTRRLTSAARQVPSNSQVAPSMAAVLRPQMQGNWLMPYLSAITPMYVESVLRGALAGNHVQVFQLFDLMVDTDPEIAACVGEYVDGVLCKKLVVEPDHEDDEEPTPEADEKAQLVSFALRNMRPQMQSDENDVVGTISDLLFARFHGQTLLETDWYDTYGSGKLNILKSPQLGPVVCPRATYWVNPVCYAWDTMGRLGLRVSQKQVRQASSKAKGQDAAFVDPSLFNSISRQPMPSQMYELPPDKFLVGVHKAKAGSVLAASCLRPLAWWWVASNFCGDYLMKTAELFGVPFRFATYPSGTSSSDKEQMRQMLQAMGSTGYFLGIDGTEMQFLESGSSGNNSPQGFLFHFADQQKRKVILRQTMTGGAHISTGAGGGKAGMETEDRGPKQDLFDAAARYAESVLNFQLVPSILKLNYGDGGDLSAPTIKLVDSKVGGLVDAQRDQILSQIMDVPSGYLRRKYSVPKPNAQDAIAGQDEGSGGAQLKQAAQAQKDSAEAAKIAAAKPQVTPPKPGQEDDQQEDQGGSVEAKSAQAVARDKASEALAGTIVPVLARLKKISAVTDPDTRVALLEKLLADWPALSEAVRHDDSLAKALTAEGVAAFVHGLSQPRKAKQ